MVSAKFYASIALLATLASAAPAPNPQATAPVPGDSRFSQCVSKPGSATLTEWGIYVKDFTMPSTKGAGSWGGGFLDHLKAMKNCGTVTNWQCQLDNANPQGVGCTFDTPQGCQAFDVAQAINLASGQWVYCQGDTMTYVFDSVGKIFSGLSGDLGQVGGLLAGFASKGG